jgi:enoyl-CoA hydratase/carnithine racemase
MTQWIHTEQRQHVGVILLNRPKALNSLSLDMVRALTAILHQWRDDATIAAVLIKSSHERGFCAGGDIRFFYEAGRATPQTGSALIEDFFTEEYALNHLIHFYPKPYIALMDGVVMGGGMGIAQAGPASRCRIVTERTRMAMPEVNIGLFPDVGGSYFLSRVPDQFGTYMALTGETISVADTLLAGLADFYLPAAQLPALQTFLESASLADWAQGPGLVAQFCAPWQAAPDLTGALLQTMRSVIEQHFSFDQMTQIVASLQTDNSAFALQTLAALGKRSPLMQAVTLAQLRVGASLGVADCLRMERTMVRRNFEHGEVLEGVRALVIDKDNTPRWSAATWEQVSSDMVQSFFQPAWPACAHPLRDLA